MKEYHEDTGAPAALPANLCGLKSAQNPGCANALMLVMLASMQRRDALGHTGKQKCLSFPWDLVPKSLVAEDAAGDTGVLKPNLQVHKEQGSQTGLVMDGLKR